MPFTLSLIYNSALGGYSFTDDGQTVDIRPGMTHYCPPGHSHSVVNTGTEPLVILGVVPNVK